MNAIVYLVLVTFSWQATGLVNYAHAFDGEPAKKTRVESPWTKLNRAVGQLEATLARVDSDLTSSQGADEALDALWVLEADIEDIDELIGESFEQAEASLEDAGADQPAMQRHHRAVESYVSQRELLFTRLDSIRKARGAEQMRERVAQLRDLLSQRHRSRQVRPVQPETLPHRSPKVEPREPRTKPDRSLGFNWLPSEGIAVAALDPVALLLAQAGAAPPVPEDSAANGIDVVFTDEITALAASLGNNPVRIYEHVRNEFEFDPTYGSIKGAQGTLWSGGGNAFDLASLLIALLRVSGIPAKYETATVDVPIETAMKWVGATDPEAASSVFSSGGIPAVAIIQNGEIIKVRMEHVMVRAWVDYTPSRGGAVQAGDRWVLLDPSFKEIESVAGVDFDTALALDGEDLWNTLMAGSKYQKDGYHVTGVDASTIQTEVARFRDTLSTQVQANPPEVLRELVGLNRTIKKVYGILPPTATYDIVSVLEEYAEIPNSLRHRISFELADVEPPFQSTVFSHTEWLPVAAGRRITLSYTPADIGSENYLTNQVPQPLPGETPNDTAARMPDVLDAKRVRVRGELRIGGELKASSSTAIGIGYDQQFSLRILTPGNYANGNVVNDIVAGAFQAVVLNLGGISTSYLDGRREVLEGFADQIRLNDATGISKDNFFGEVLHLAGLKYWVEMNLFEKVAERMAGVTATRLPTEGIFSHDLGVEYCGMLVLEPCEVWSAGLGTDIDHDLQAVVSNDLDPERSRTYLLMTGLLGSYMEGSVYDQLLSELDASGEGLSFTGVSTAHILGYANAQGIPVYHIDSTNLAEVMPRLQIAGDVKAAIRSAVNSGLVVTVPEREMTIEGWWTGVGYAAIDPDTGAGGYLISGGTAGGGFDLDFLRNPLVSFILGALLIFAGIFAAGLVAVLLAVVGIAIIGYQLAADISDIQNNPDYTDSDREMLIAFYVMLAVIGALLAVAGIFFGPLGVFVAIALYYLYISIMAALIMGTLAPLMARRRNQLDDILDGNNTWLERLFDRWPGFKDRLFAARDGALPAAGPAFAADSSST